ncbi:hypothetical protein C0J08_09705 [Marinomonas sp. CT5]|uniref:SIR2 family protein n=1 Tax=Marinomonas sp. CT5 TaxID=2066133 RepID=UPI001BAF4EC3|nr:SIR2 family protein [Marinomonas sp. CT5]QUX95668.1 hypothetical protein C0J08_09705 [Marinomonas sp. CT5]
MNKPSFDSNYVINRVEQYLQSKLAENSEFNDEVNHSASVEISDEGPKVRIKSLTDPETEFSYDISEILYWIERDTYFDELAKWNGVKLEEMHRDAVVFLKETHQYSLFMDLVDAIRRQRIAPFIGAGASLPAGYPSWGNALKSLAKSMGEKVVESTSQLLKACDYLPLAEILFQHNEHLFLNFVQTEFRLKPTHEDDKPIFPPVIDLLPQITSSCIITTNFDRLIEKRFELLRGRPLQGYMYGKQAQNGFVTQLLKGEHCLLKLHGDVEEPQSYVFTDTQYSEAYGTDAIDFTKQLPRSLRQIYVSHSLLFLGCSLEQDRTLELFKSVKDEGHFEIPNHFALLPEPKQDDKPEKMGRLLSMNIKPIWYRTDNHDHSMLEKILMLATDVASKRYSLGAMK